MNERGYDAWYCSLTQEERDSLKVKLCRVCCHAFDDNPTKIVCKACDGWAVDENGFVYV